jgi:hypothetical protein
MKTREEVKKGLITAVDAMHRIDPNCATSKWLMRRITRKPVENPEQKTVPEQKNNKYRHKPRKVS